MKNRLLSFIIIYTLILITGCERNESDNEVLPKQLTATKHDTRCFWSPNGKFIAFLSYRNTYNPDLSGAIFELWIMDKDGTGQRPLLTHNELYAFNHVSNVSWSSDSKILLAEIQTPNGSEIWKISIDGNKTKMTSIDQYAEQPKYSPDGTKVAFILRSPCPCPPGSSPIYRLYSANPDFSDTIMVEKGIIDDYDWTHKTKGFVYSLYNQINENCELWKSSLDGAQKLRLTEIPINEVYLSCSYDGNYISYSDDIAVYLAPLDNFKPSLLLDSAKYPAWVPNRNLILLHNLSGSLIIDIKGKVIMNIDKSNQVAFSSTGDYFTYTKDGNIWLDKLPY
jgi:Tol biopolymer transport system component